MSHELEPLQYSKAFTIAEDGLDIKSQPTFDEWAGLGHVFALMHKSLAFAIGDWLNYGEDRFGEKAAQVIDSRHFSENTVRVYRWVAKQVPRSRRFPELSFKHHMAVAGLAAPEQKTWLRKASESTLSVSQMKRAMVEAPDIEQSFWLVVRCESQEDLTQLQTRLESEGRTCKSRGGNA